MKNVLKIGAAVCLLLFFSACGGAPRRETEEPGPELLEKPLMDVQYKETYYPFSGGYSVVDVARLEDKLLILGQRIEEDPETGADTVQGSVLGLADYTVSDTGRAAVSEARILATDGAETAAVGIAAGDDGNFTVLAYAGREGEYALSRLDVRGQTLDSMSVRLGDGPVRELNVTPDGEPIIVGISSAFSIRWREGIQAVARAPDRSWFESAAWTGEGLLLYTLDGLYQMDPETGTLTATAIPLGGGSGESYVSLAGCQGLAGELLSNTGSSLYEYDRDGGAWRQLLSWQAEGLGPVCRLSEGSFILALRGEAMLLTGFEKAPYSEDSRSPVQVALLGARLDEACRDDPLYDYQAVSYTGEFYGESFDQELRRFLTGMAAGDVPDLILFRGSGLDTSSAAFEDLYPYIDRDLSREDFLPHFLEALSYNGELHELWTQTTIRTVLGRYADVGEGIGLGLEDYRQMVETSPAYEALFPAYVSREYMLGYVSCLGVNCFTDRENAAVHLDDPAFASLIALCAQLPEALPEGDPRWADLRLPSGQVLLFPESLEPLYMTDELCESLGGPLVPVGMPDGGEGFSYYELSALGGVGMAIPSRARNKEGAWAYIRSRLSLDAQLAAGVEEGIPVNVQALERLSERSLTPQGRRLLEDALSRTKYAQTFSDQGLKDIISSSVQAYLAGDRSLEETITLLRSRAGIYIAERFG